MPVSVISVGSGLKSNSHVVVSLELHTSSLESSLVCLASVVLLAQMFGYLNTS